MPLWEIGKCTESLKSEMHVEKALLEVLHQVAVLVEEEEAFLSPLGFIDRTSPHDCSLTDAIEKLFCRYPFKLTFIILEGGVMN